ncbi:MAG: RDD family protein [Flavobacterium sp.]
MSELSIVTTQNVHINFNTAHIGDRILAYVIDLVVKVAYFLVLIYLIGNIGFVERFFNSLDSDYSRIVLLVTFLLPYFLYSLVLESLWEGQTIGKRIMKIKVVKIDGFQASFGDYLILCIFRLVDINITSVIIGLVLILFSSKNQRLGDMTAGTAVISLKNNININHTILEEINEQYVPIYPQVIKLSDNDMRIIKETYEKASATRDFGTLIKLRTKVEQVTGIKNQSGNDIDFIRTVLKDYNYYTQGR